MKIIEQVFEVKGTKHRVKVETHASYAAHREFNEQQAEHDWERGHFIERRRRALVDVMKVESARIAQEAKVMYAIVNAISMKLGIKPELLASKSADELIEMMVAAK